jgi:hypothetical protein
MLQHFKGLLPLKPAERQSIAGFQRLNAPFMAGFSVAFFLFHAFHDAVSCGSGPPPRGKNII